MRRWMTMLCAAALAGCATTSLMPTAPGIDWAQAPVARLRIAAGFFHPELIDLALGRPVRLVFDNGDGFTHDFVTGFFTTVAQRPGEGAGNGFLSSGPGPGKPVGGTRVILQPAETIEYDIVPKQAGLFAVSSILPNGSGMSPATLRVR